MNDNVNHSHQVENVRDSRAERAASSSATEAYGPGMHPEANKGADTSAGALPTASLDDKGISFGPNDGGPKNNMQNTFKNSDGTSVQSSTSSDGTRESSRFDENGFKTNSETKRPDGSSTNTSFDKNGNAIIRDFNPNGDLVHGG